VKQARASSAIFLVLLVVLSVGLVRAEGAAQRSWCVSVWYPSSDDPTGLDSLTAHSDVIDIVNPFWYTAGTDANIEAQPTAEDAEQLHAWREAGMRVLPTIFSSRWEMLRTAETRETHVQNILSLVEKMGYDGVDIDYEDFARSTRDDFSALIERLGEALHARGLLLSIAVHAKTTDAGTWEGPAAQDWTRLAPAVDIFNVMTYDYTSRNAPPGSIAPTDWVESVLAYAATVTDLHKVHMGLPFYGYRWLRDKPPAAAVTWTGTQRLIDSFKLTVGRQPDQEAHIELKTPGLPKQTIWFVDSAAVQYKLDAITAQYPDLGGVAIWGLGGEDPANWDVLRQLRHSECALKRERNETTQGDAGTTEAP
jgi:spore germination protein YaaH